jgi:hypothetical protein
LRLAFEGHGPKHGVKKNTLNPIPFRDAAGDALIFQTRQHTKKKSAHD